MTWLGGADCVLLELLLSIKCVPTYVVVVEITEAVLSRPRVVTSSILYQVNYLLCDSDSLYVTGVCGKYCVFQYLETESLL